MAQFNFIHLNRNLLQTTFSNAQNVKLKRLGQKLPHLKGQESK